MKTWCLPNWWQIILFFALLAINTKNCVQSSASASDPKNIDQSLRILQESLRWVRSPTPGTRFRPWGGKRNLLLCLKPAQFFDLRMQTKCQSYSDKKDRQTSTDMALPEYNLLSDNKNDNVYLQSQDVIPIFEKGMPETVDEEDDSLENGSVNNFSSNLSNYPKLKKNTQHQARSEESSNEKKHTFYPWAGKRTQAFYPWAGKRSNNPIYTTNDNGQNTTVTKMKEFFSNKLYNTGNVHRKKREIDYYNSKSADSQLLKRSTIQLWKESTKRIGILSDLLKEFENFKGGSVQRGFHPWAGKKRSDRELNSSIIQNYQIPLIPNYITQDKGTDKLFLNRGHPNSVLADKRHSFYPWAGKRNFYESNSGNWVEESQERMRK